MIATDTTLLSTTTDFHPSSQASPVSINADTGEIWRDSRTDGWIDRRLFSFIYI